MSRSRCGRSLRILSILSATLALLDPLPAQGTRVNAPLPPGIVGDVTASQISPDSARVVYLADQEADEVFQLYSVRIGGGHVVGLGATPVPGGDVRSFQISANSRRVVYLADEERDQSVELFSAPIDGRAARTKLNASLPSGQQVQGFQITADSRRVIHAIGTAQARQLYSVPVAGGTVTRLDQGLLSDEIVSGSYVLSPDGKHVVYGVARGATAPVHALYRVAAEGGPPVRLDGPPVPAQGARGGVEISPDSRLVLYTVRVGSDSRWKLHGVPILGGTPHEIAELTGPYRVTPDSQQVVFVGDEFLRRVPISGGPSLRLSVPQAEYERVRDFVIAPGSKRIVYSVLRSDGDVSHDVALRSVPLGGGADTLLFREPGLSVSPPAVSPDSREVVFSHFRPDADDSHRHPVLCSVPIDGGEVVELADSWHAFGAFTPDSSAFLFVPRASFDPVFAEIFRVPLGGGTPVQVSGAGLEQGGVADSSPQMSPSGTRTVYRAEQDSDGAFQLYSLPLGGGLAVRLNGPLPLGPTAGDVQDFVTSPDGSRVVYRVDQEVDQVFELYSAPVPGGTPTRLSGTLVTNGDVAASGFQVSRDSTRVVYMADQEVAGIRELYGVPIDGGPLHELNSARGAGTGVDRFEISPDSLRVVYRNDRDHAGVPQLFSVAIEGGPSVELTESLALASVGELRVSPDSSRVVFQADRLLDGAGLELFVAPIAGGPLTRLTPDAVDRGGVAHFEVLPGSEGVVYLADLEADEVFELFDVPIAGGASRKLNRPVSAAGDVVGFALSPDGQHVVYRGDQELDEVFELHAVSRLTGVDTLLNPRPVAGGDVHEFQISPDSSRVVYRADQDVRDRYELYAVSITGGGAVRLNPAFSDGGMDVGGDGVQAFPPFAVSPASDRVVYLAELVEERSDELWTVPITGGPSTRLNAPLPSGWSVVRPIAVASDARHVVFVAANGLFAAPIAGGGATRLDTGGRVVASAADLPPFRATDALVLYRADPIRWQTFELFWSPLPQLRTTAPAPVAAGR